MAHRMAIDVQRHKKPEDTSVSSEEIRNIPGNPIGPNWKAIRKAVADIEVSGSSSTTDSNTNFSRNHMNCGVVSQNVVYRPVRTPMNCGVATQENRRMTDEQHQPSEWIYLTGLWQKNSEQAGQYLSGKTREAITLPAGTQISVFPREPREGDSEGVPQYALKAALPSNMQNQPHPNQRMPAPNWPQNQGQGQ